MAITVTVEKAQANFYQYLNQLDDGIIDKLIVQDGGSNLFQVVTAAVYEAADPGGSAAATDDLVAAYSISPGYQGKGLYRMIKRMRDKQAGPDAQVAVGAIDTVAKASMLDGETVTLTNAAGDGYTFEFDVPGDGVTTGNIQVDISGVATADEIATVLAGVIDGTGGFSASAATNVVTITQSDPGTSGNTTIIETVANTAFVVTDFAGGTDVDVTGGTIKLFNSKNDSAARAYMVPEDHAVAIGL